MQHYCLQACRFGLIKAGFLLLFPYFRLMLHCSKTCEESFSDDPAGAFLDDLDALLLHFGGGFAVGFGFR